jgi:hypothetical protein
VDIDRVIKQREKWLEWKDIVPKREALKSIQPPSECSVEIDDYIKILATLVTNSINSLLNFP